MRRILPALTAFLMTLGLFVGVPVAAADSTISEVSVADATVRSDNPDTKIWGLEYLRVEADTPVRQAYVKFDVSGIPAGDTVTSATLTLHGLTAATGNLTASSTSNAWLENGITWNNRPAVGAVLDSSPYGSVVNLDVSSAVDANGEVSFVVTTDAVDFRDFAARENVTASLRPTLTVQTITPPPPPPSSSIALGHYRNRPGESGNWLDKVNKAEVQFGTFEGHVHDYEGVGSNGQLTTLHIQALASGHRVFVNWKPWSTNWAQVANGSRNSVITAAANQWAANCDPGECWITIGHEPENDIGGAGSGMTAADFIGMFRQTASIFHAQAPEVDVIWTVIGDSGHRAEQQALWPGAAYADMIGHDPYIVCGGPPANLANFLIGSSNWLRNNLAGASNLPVVVTEWGADLGGSLSSCSSGGDIGTPQHRADAINGVRTRLSEVIAAGVIEMDFFDSRSDAFSCAALTCVDAQAYKALKTATEAV